MQKRYWLRGGIIFFIVTVAIFGWTYSSSSIRDYQRNGVISQGGLFLSGGADCHPVEWWNNLPEKYPGEKPYNDQSCQRILITTPILFILLFSVPSCLIGLFLGWLYGKIKNRRSVS